MQVEGLIHELLLCVGLFTVLETRNQDVLLWGKVPTPVHKLCTLFNSLAEQPSVASSLKCALLAVGIPNQPLCEVMHLHSLHPDSFLPSNMLTSLLVGINCLRGAYNCSQLSYRYFVPRNPLLAVTNVDCANTWGHNCSFTPHQTTAVPVHEPDAVADEFMQMLLHAGAATQNGAFAVLRLGFGFQCAHHKQQAIRFCSASSAGARQAQLYSTHHRKPDNSQRF